MFLLSEWMANVWILWFVHLRSSFVSPSNEGLALIKVDQSCDLSCTPIERQRKPYDRLVTPEPLLSWYLRIRELRGTARRGNEPIICWGCSCQSASVTTSAT